MPSPSIPASEIPVICESCDWKGTLADCTYKFVEVSNTAFHCPKCAAEVTRTRRAPGVVALKPFVSRGEPIIRNDGSIDQVPVQLIESLNKGCILRIGATTFWFNDDGTYDGTEHLIPHDSEIDHERLVSLLHQSKDNRGLPPEKSYFDEGSDGYKAEKAGWPAGDYEVLGPYENPDGDAKELEAVPYIDPAEHVQVRLIFGEEDSPQNGWVFTIGMAKFNKPELEMRGIPRYLYDSAGGLMNHVAGLILNDHEGQLTIESKIEVGPLSRLRFQLSTPIPGEEQFFTDERWEILETEDVICQECGKAHSGDHDLGEDISTEEALLLTSLKDAFPEVDNPTIVFNRLDEIGIMIEADDGDPEHRVLSEEAAELLRSGNVNEIIRRVCADGWTP